MYKYIQSIVAFVAVGESGAFVKAAKKLGVTPSVISHHIARLEDELGETLVHRTTRKLTLSDNGRRLFESAQSGLKGIELSLAQIDAGANKVSGTLRIALPAFIPDPALEAKIMAFILLHPNISLTLDHSDNVKDLIEEGYDLAIRLGGLPSSSLICRKIGSISHMLVATPTLLKQYNPLNSPNDLAGLPYISMGAPFNVLTLTCGEETLSVSLEVSQLKVQSILAMKSAALAGIGFGNLPKTLVDEEIASGQLLHILPEWELPQLSIQAVWSASSRRSSLVKRLVDHLVDQ